MHALWNVSEDLVRPEAAALVDDARAAGVPVGALTNDLRAFHGDGAMSAHPLLAALDVLVDGSDTGGSSRTRGPTRSRSRRCAGRPATSCSSTTCRATSRARGAPA